MPVATIANTIVRISRYQSVRRTRIGTSPTPFGDAGAKNVALVATGNDPMRLDAVNFAPQPVDVNLDDVRERIEVFVPDVFSNLGAADHAVRVARHVFEQRVFLRGERHF